MPTVLTIAHLTLLEARRRRILLAGLVCGLAFVLVFATGLSLIERNMRFDTPFRGIQSRIQLHILTIAALYAANFLTLFVAVLVPIDTLFGEISSGVVQTLASKPVRREEIVFGKWIAHWLVVATYLAVTAGGVILATRLIGGFLLPQVGRGLALMLISATVMLTVSIAGGTRLSTVANGIVAFGIYGLAFIGGWIEQIGSIVAGTQTARDAVRDVGIIASLLNPTDSLRRLAAYHMAPPIIRDVPMNPFTPVYPPSLAMVVWSLGYVIVVLLIAMRQFRRRPL